MSQSKYNKMQVNPFKQEWEKTGIALLTEVDAETLNANTIHTGIKYEAEKKTVTKPKK